MQAKICSLVLPIKDVLACEAMMARWPVQELTASPVNKSHRASCPDFFGMSRFSINLKMLGQPAVSQNYWLELGSGGGAPVTVNYASSQGQCYARPRTTGFSDANRWLMDLIGNANYDRRGIACARIISE